MNLVNRGMRRTGWELEVNVSISTFSSDFSLIRFVQNGLSSVLPLVSNYSSHPWSPMAGWEFG